LLIDCEEDRTLRAVLVGMLGKSGAKHPGGRISPPSPGGRAASTGCPRSGWR
jgi:hypothetical protein